VTFYQINIRCNRRHCCTVCSENHAPILINGDTTLEVQFGQTYTSLVTVRVLDADGDTVSFSVTTDSPPGLNIDKTSGALSWTSVPDMGQGNSRKTLKVVIIDGKVQVLWVPHVKFCKCQVRHMCTQRQDVNCLTRRMITTNELRWSV